MTANQHTSRAVTIRAYRDNSEYLSAELTKLDLLIRLKVAEFRLLADAARESAGSSQMYISHEEVDWLLEGRVLLRPDTQELQALRERLERCQAEIDLRAAACATEGVALFLPRLARMFGLSPFEVQAIVICLAPQLERKYDKLFAYLQDDITRKKPTIDLVLGLLCRTDEEKWRLRPHLSAGSRLLRAELLRIADDPQSPSGSADLAKFLMLDPRILGYLTGHHAMDDRLLHCARLYRQAPEEDHLLVDQKITILALRIARSHFSGKDGQMKKLVFHFEGAYGVGRRALALEVCAQACCPLLYLDLEMIAHDPDFEVILKRAFREGLLQQAALYLDHVDVMLDDTALVKTQLKKMLGTIAEYGWLIFLAGEKTWPPKHIFEDAHFHPFAFPAPDVPLREAAWMEALKRVVPGGDRALACELAQQFRLTPGEIFDAAETVLARRGADDGDAATVTRADLYSACRSRSNRSLGETAVKIEPRCGWDDLILTEDKSEQLREICSQVRHHDRVFREWGFGRKLSHGKGLSVLFSGPPGTGKTLAAEVIAAELGLDLYKIDLSSVVSKYIGETEKNLSKIFKEAETSNAILFFDEADALFGKRTEVSDAHDRYANIETSYLLQKMEEYEGVVILATNLQENMDDAFLRRIRCIVDFPFPDADSRLRIWKAHMPAEAPKSDDIDFEALSRNLQVAGGNIKNIALTSAFFAAENGGKISMKHILRGAQREFEKMGKVWEEHSALSRRGKKAERGMR